MTKPSNKTPTTGHNNPPPPTFTDVLKTLAVDLNALKVNAMDAGKASASGNDSILSLGLRVYASAKYAGLPSGDVAQVYAEYCKGQNDTQYGAKIDIANAKSMKAGRSKLLCFHKLANIAGARDYAKVVPQTIALINAKAAAEGKGKGGSLYEQVLKVVRNTVKNGDRALPSDDELYALLFPPKPDKTLVDKLDAIDVGCQVVLDSKATDPYYKRFFIRVQETVRGAIKEIKDDAEIIRLENLRNAETNANDPEPEGDEPEGDEPEGNEPEGDEPEGDEPEGDEPEGDEDGDTRTNEEIEGDVLSRFLQAAE